MKKKKERKKEKNLRSKYVYVLLFIFLFIFFIYLFSVLNSEIIYKKKIPAELVIGQFAGFDINKTLLTFGTITALSNSKRQLKLENNYLSPVKFEVDIEGNISDFLIFEDKIYLAPGKNKTFNIIAFANNKTSGKYSGNLIITAKKLLI